MLCKVSSTWPWPPCSTSYRHVDRVWWCGFCPKGESRASRRKQVPIQGNEGLRNFSALPIKEVGWFLPYGNSHCEGLMQGFKKKMFLPFPNWIVCLVGGTLFSFHTGPKFGILWKFYCVAFHQSSAKSPSSGEAAEKSWMNGPFFLFIPFPNSFMLLNFSLINLIR